MKPFQVAVAAEAFAAGMLAQAGCDVSVQYGANQPEYDLIATLRNRFIKVSVKGSQDGAWGFVQKFKQGRSYHGAVAELARRQSTHVVYCFVQFDGVGVGECPRAYLATVREVACHLKAARDGNGTTILHEEHEYRSGIGGGTTDRIPERWQISRRRIEEMLGRVLQRPAAIRRR